MFKSRSAVSRTSLFWKAMARVALLALFGASAVLAYQIPTTTSGAWTAIGTTAGRKDTPSGLRTTIGFTGSANTLGALTNTASQTQNTITTPSLPSTTNGMQIIYNSSAICSNAATVCPGVGTLTINFSDAAGTPISVKNPVLHIARMGGALSYSGGGNPSADYVLGATLALTSSGVVLGSPSTGSRGMLVTGGNQISTDLANFPSTLPLPSTPPVVGDCTAAPTTVRAGCGSIPITGTVSSLSFDVSLVRRAVGNLGNWQNPNNGTWAGDGIYFTVSFDEDFGDAPATFDPTAAASHLISDLQLGSSIDRENPTPTAVNGGATGTPLVTPSPAAVLAGADNNDTNGDGADEDAISSFPVLTTNSTTYSLSVPISGASRAGQVCGWIDFNRSNTFTNASPIERACASFAASASSVTLNWTGLSGQTAGNNYVRLRTSYDTTGVQNPTGVLNSGEVEDYRLAITAPPVSVSGTVWNDGNGNVIQAALELGTDAGSNTLTVYAVDALGNVIDKADVDANGSYTLTNVPQSSSVTLRLSNDASVNVGAPAPATILPTGWVNTGENKNGVVETVTPGEIALNTTTVNLANQNFGIERLPDTQSQSSTQANPGGTNTVQVPAINFTDPEDNNNVSTPATSICVTAPLPSNATLAYAGTVITTLPACFPTYDPALLTVDPQDGNQTVLINVVAVDAANKVDPSPAVITMDFTSGPPTVTINGQVWNDINGDIAINSPELGTNAAGLTVYAVDALGNVVGKATVNSNGSYAIGGLPQNANITLRLSTDSSATLGNPAPATASLPTGWVNTGENKNGVTETTTPGEIALNTGISNISNQNFGIQQPPTATGATGTANSSTGANTNVPSGLFSSSDPDGQISKYTILSIPPNVDSLTIGGVTYNSSNPIPVGGVDVTANLDGSFPSNAVSFDPKDGVTSVVIPFRVTDNGGAVSNNANATVLASIKGTVWIDSNGNQALDGGESGTNVASSTLTVYLTNGSDVVIAKTTVTATGDFSFFGIASGTYTMILSNDSSIVIGAVAPAPSLPSGYGTTGENTGDPSTGTPDGNPNGKITITVP